MSKLVTALGLIVAVTGAAPAATTAAPAPGSPELEEASYVPGELLVKFKETISDAKKSNIHSKNGGQKLKEYKELRLHRVKLKEKDKVKSAAQRYQADPDVEYAEPNYLVGLKRTSNDPMLSSLTGLAKIKAQQAWDTATGSSNVVAAILDTGIDLTHPDLKANLWINTWDPANGGDNDGNGYVDDLYGINAITGGGNVSDDHGHGTHVAGTIGATGNNGIGVVGVNWTVKLLPCKILDASGKGTVADAVESLIYLKALKERTQDPVNIAVINASWGFEGYSYSLYDAIKAMGDTLFVAAAGNETTNSEVTPSYPANYRLPNVISVAATTLSDTLAPFSNYGKNLVDVGAPGVDIFSTYLNGGYGVSSGTSMAAPHVSGVAALLKAQDPLRDGRKIKNLILSSGESFDALAGKTATGKRIDAAAATACFDKTLLSPGRLPFPASSGNVYTLTARSLNCDAPVGPVTVTTSAGETIALQDGGTLADAEAGDGIFSANWTGGTFPVTLTFSSPAGTKSVTLPPLKAHFHIADARTHVPYFQSLGVEGGTPPYTWALPGGGLPAGLNLDPATGVISGTATVATESSIIAEVTDASGNKASADIHFRVVAETVDQNWGRVFGGDGNDRGHAVTSDPSGNFYVSGKIFNGQNDDLFISKYGPSGALLWTRTFDKGNDETGYSVARDSEGNILVAGYSVSSQYLVVLLKYSPSGNLLWADTSVVRYPSMSHPAVTVDSAGNAYLVSPGYLPGYESVRLAKYSPSGTVVWQKTHDDTSANFANAVAVDASGNIYFGGSRVGNSGYWDSFLAKYDAAGNTLWARSVPDEGQTFIEGIAWDGSGYIVATGRTIAYNSNNSAGVTMKYDSDGNRLWKTATPLWHLLRGVAVAAGGIYVTGERYDRGPSDFVTLKYDQTGRELWEKSLDAGRSESAYGITADAGGITVVGYGQYYDNEEVLLARYSDNSVAVNDLVISSFSASLSGSTLSYDLTVKNNGPGYASIAVMLYLSADNVPNTTDHAVTYLYPAESLGGGMEKRLSGSVVVPATIPSGTFYPTAIVDPGGYVYETDETNNGAVDSRSYTFTASASDLVVTDVTGSVASGAITYSVTVANSGNLDAAASTTTLYLWSGGSVVTLENPLTTISTPALAAGAQTVLTGSVPVPPTVPQGIYYLLASADSGSSVAEKNEGNNGSSGSQITLTNDLSISALSSTLSDGTFSYSITLENLGNASANAPLSFYLSSDATASPSDILIRQLAAGTVAGGSSKTLTGTIAIPSSVGPGSYYLTAIVDPANVVPETSESNNAAVGQLYRMASDLQVTGFSATLSGGRISYSLTVKNVGNLASAPASSSLYLSSDAIASTSDQQLVSFITLALAPGAERTTASSVSLPQTVAPGSYRAVAIVDTGNLVAEWDETNNSAVGELFSFANDLSVTGVSGTLSAGVLSYSLTVSNNGSGSAAVPVYLYFSPDASASANDVSIRQISVSVAGGTQKALSGTLTVPSTVPSGAYYLAAVVDPANAVMEYDEVNNRSVSAGTFTIASDVQVTAVSATLAAGKMSYSVTVRNAGTIGAPSTQTGLYLSADGVASSSDHMVARISTPTIAAGGVRIVSGSVAVPATIPPGSYGVAAIADSADSLKETVETNNSALGNQVVLSNDLSVTALSGSVSAGVLSYTLTVRNTGSGSVTAPVNLYFSPDAVASTHDIVIRQLSASGIAGGSEKVLTGTVAVPGTVPTGSYYLTAVADPANAVAESSEANNGAVAERITITSDLDVTQVSATLAGGKLTYSITVKNYGSIGAPATKTGLYFSADGVAATSDLLVSSISTSPIPYGGEKVLTGSVPVPAGMASGTYYVAAVADAENVVLEGTEGNNGAVGNQVTLANDLSLASFSGSVSAGVLSYTVTVRNSGTGSASAPVYLYFSADATASVNDLLIKQLSATTVPGGTEKSLTGSFAVPGTVPSGSYYIAALVDPAGAVPESNEGNNGAVAETFTLSSDLKVTGVSAALAKGKLTYSVTVKNAGNVGTPSTSTGLYLSLDGIASTTDLLLGSISTAAIPYGAEKVLTGSVTVPATVAPRSYYVTAIADSTNLVSETVETGNGLAGNMVTLSNDLSITALSGSLTNGVLSYSMTLRNSGTGNPPVAAKLYFSADNTPSVNDIVLKEISAGSIPGETEKVVTGTLTVPGTVASGTYYLAALADPANALVETVEANNGAVASQISVNTDLRIVAVSATVSGGRASYSVTVRNSGNIASAASATGLYLSTDTVAATSDLLLTSITTAAIPPGTDKVLTGSATVPTSVGPGSYYVAAIADTANGTRESVESNNTMTGNQVTLSNDLSVTALSGSLSGGVLSYSVTVANAGNLNPTVPVALSFSTDAVASANDYQLKLLPGSVPGGTQRVLTGTVTIPGTVPTGSFYLVALADPAGSVAETNESNNGRIGAQYAVNSDLRVTAVSGSVTAGVLSYSVTVANAGNIAAAASSTGVYLSADSTPSLSDYRVASLSTAAIPAGGVKVFTGRVTVPATVPAGSYYLAGIADIAGVVTESAEGNNGAVGGTVAR